jgi:hypothetical protein
VQANTINVLAMCRETSFAGVTALLSSLLLQCSSGHAPVALSAASLPCRFLATAHAALTALNNVFLLSLEQAQELVAAGDLRTELLFCVSSLVAFCTEQWGDGSDCEARTTSPPRAELPCSRLRTRTPYAVDMSPAQCSSRSRQPRQRRASQRSESGACEVQVVETLNEAVLLAGFFASGRPAHQERLRWGRAPSLLSRLCALPPEYLLAGSTPESPVLDGADASSASLAPCQGAASAARHAALPHVLLPTLIAACGGVARNCELVDEAVGMGALQEYACAHCAGRLALRQGLPWRFDPRRRVPEAAWDRIQQPDWGAQSGGLSGRTRSEASLANGVVAATPVCPVCAHSPGCQLGDSANESAWPWQ